MQTVFLRYEKKFLITYEQAANLQQIIASRVMPDKYATYWVQNLYLDTDNWDVICASIEKPFFKEKMRLRGYGVPAADGFILLEIKRKYDGVGYKRRVSLPASAINRHGLSTALQENNTQIAKELAYYLNTTQVSEKMFISYNRTAFTGIEDESLRITFDADIKYRSDELHFQNPGEGRSILPSDVMLLEIKTHTNFPLWLTQSLSEFEIYVTSFSKYGRCFIDYTQNSSERLVETSA